MLDKLKLLLNKKVLAAALALIVTMAIVFGSQQVVDISCWVAKAFEIEVEQCKES